MKLRLSCYRLIGGALVVVSAPFTKEAFASVTSDQTAASAVIEEPVIRVLGPMSRGTARETSSFKSFNRRADPADPAAYQRLPPADRLRATTLDYASCLYETNKRNVGPLLDMVPGSERLNAAAKTVSTMTCLASGDLQFKPSGLYQALYVHKYSTHFGRGSGNALGKAVINWSKIPTDAPTNWQQIYIVSRNFADCVVRRDPLSAHDLVVSRTSTTAENDAFAAVMPSLSGCLAQGANVKLGKEFLKGIMAEVLYRYAMKQDAIYSISTAAN